MWTYAISRPNLQPLQHHRRRQRWPLYRRAHWNLCTVSCDSLRLFLHVFHLLCTLSIKSGSRKPKCVTSLPSVMVRCTSNICGQVSWWQWEVSCCCQSCARSVYGRILTMIDFHEVRPQWGKTTTKQNKKRRRIKQWRTLIISNVSVSLVLKKRSKLRTSILSMRVHFFPSQNQFDK